MPVLEPHFVNDCWHSMINRENSYEDRTLYVAGAKLRSEHRSVARRGAERCAGSAGQLESGARRSCGGALDG
ncbi:hypothetical protein KL86PLE_41358 [uncultured Pleomorphomonas sp.]|uniref:Uncharacterized protein n=1 Tax=uncultured Pleomorphomonas sp. TaxID=442121 RepID=A0A212LJ40_9HYPH|nr:hypothetical protein KL86PLE_41358 [uncultured Pleomorphomonas sp.]